MAGVAGAAIVVGAAALDGAVTFDVLRCKHSDLGVLTVLAEEHARILVNIYRLFDL